MLDAFDPNFVGLQINWKDDEEIEFFGPAVLGGMSSCTAAVSSKGRRKVHYLYPIEVVKNSDSELILEYKENPRQWPSRWGWGVCKGRLIINFGKGRKEQPTDIGFQHHDGGEFESLDRGVDWEYVCSCNVVGESRRRVQASKIERPSQQALRNLLISEYGKCQVTGAHCVAVLEACHIVPVKSDGVDVVANALLLRRDIHALFDAGLLQFILRGSEWRILVDKGIEDAYLKELHENVLINEAQAHPSHPYLLERAKLDLQAKSRKGLSVSNGAM